MFIGQGHNVNKILKICRVPSSTWYHRNSNKSRQKEKNKAGRPCSDKTALKNGHFVKNTEVVDRLKELRKKKFHDQYGYRKLMHILKRDYSFIINHKKLYRPYREASLALPIKRKQKRRGKKICMNRNVTAPNQLWQFDIKYGFIDGENRFFFLMAFIDIFSREIVHYHIGTR